MVERNLLSTFFIIVYLGVVLGSNHTRQKDSDEDDDDVARGNVESGHRNDSNLKLSCLTCNNVEFDECNNPQKKKVPVNICKNNDDVCYSMHTPFGVIDRGCYNPNRNMTTYVCACNLCNNLPFKSLPVKFTTVKDWLENVIDLSRTRSLRKSILKKISCVRCEANTEFNTSYSCYDGTITDLPAQECSNGEICGIKYIKNPGFIWRGCVKKPLYNYWWSFCHKNLCNFEVLRSIYSYFYKL